VPDMRWNLVLVLAFAASSPTVFGRLEAQEPLHVETRLVEVEVRVNGKDRRPVMGLTKEDFVVKENGKRQEVSTVDFVKSRKLPQGLALQSTGHSRETLQSAGPAAVSQTWIYIDTEVEAVEVPQTCDAIKRFLSEELEPGLMVSLAGSPFTNDRPRLLEMLEKMKKGPFGHWPETPAMINPQLTWEKSLEFEWLSAAGSSTPAPGFAGLSVRPNERGEGPDITLIEQEMSLGLQIALFHYLELTHKLEDLPGKKIVIVFRSGLRMDPENMRLFDILTSDAVRHRISFYTVDSRGLFEINPSSSREEALSYGVLLNGVSSATNYQATQMIKLGREEGLVALANETGGKAVLNTNDMHTVFADVLEDSANYYIVSYYPTVRSKIGQFKKITVAVDRPDAKVYATPGYYEDLPSDTHSKSKRELGLWRDMESKRPNDYPVAATCNFFRGSDGQPVAVLSAGVHVGDLTAKGKGRVDEFGASIVTRVSSAASGTLPFVRGQHSRLLLTPEQYLEAKSDESVFVTYNTQIPLAPGKYVWKVLFHDDNSGKIGVVDLPLEVPDYGELPTASTLLLTRQVVARQTDQRATTPLSAIHEKNNLLAADNLVFVAQPEESFRIGDSLYLLFDLYNPPSYDLDAVSGHLQTKLRRNNGPLSDIHLSWKAVLGPEKGMIRFISSIDSHDLLSGEYEVVEFLPAALAHEKIHLSARFTLRP
jgi:VWFA-related protein